MREHSPAGARGSRWTKALASALSTTNPAIKKGNGATRSTPRWTCLVAGSVALPADCFYRLPRLRHDAVRRTHATESARPPTASSTTFMAVLHEGDEKLFQLLERLAQPIRHPGADVE